MLTAVDGNASVFVNCTQTAAISVPSPTTFCTQTVVVIQTDAADGQAVENATAAVSISSGTELLTLPAPQPVLRSQV